MSIATGGKEGAGEVPKVSEPPFGTTDMGNAARFARDNKDRVRFCQRLGGWLIWRHGCWEADETMQVERWARGTLARIKDEALELTDRQEALKLFKWAQQSEANQRFDSMLKLARSEAGMSVGFADFDRNGWLLNTPSGMVDLKTGKSTGAPRPDDMVTKITGARYDPKAKCPKWESFVSMMCGEDEEVYDFLQNAAGYSLTGETGEQCFFVLHGPSGNGKSQFLTTLRLVMGGYAMHTPSDTLLTTNKGSARNDLARLRGARFVTAIETDEGGKFAQALVKQMTGDDVMTARFLHKEFFEFTPQFKVWVATNDKPVVSHNDKAFWRRVKLVPFMTTVDKDARVAKFGERLFEEEGPGILAWMVRGCMAWQRDGSLGEPEVVTKATNEYRDEMDTLVDFLEARCVVGEEHRAPFGIVYDVYSEWAKRNGYTRMSAKTFSRRLEMKDFRRYRDGTTRWILGLKVARS